MVEESPAVLPPAEESIEAETDTALEPKPESDEQTPESTMEPGFVCECEERMRSACKGLPFYKEHGSRRYCVLHYPGKEKSADFKAALDSKLDKKDFNFRGVWFPDKIDFNGVEFSAAANLSFATFSANADFNLAHFSAGANFSSATFSETANFRHARFSAVADFKSATFKVNADFNHAAFSTHADFSNATFNARLDFRSATFSVYANFRSARFSADADFRYAGFSADADFSSATFLGDVDFSDASFIADAHFGGTIFNAHAEFKFTTFSSDANFIAVTFGGKTNFNSAKFGALAVFESATFRANAGFRSTTFSADALFNYATFNAMSYFNSATFGAVAGFNLTTFDKGGDFNSAVFNDSVSFFGHAHEGTLIDGTRIRERALGKESSLDFQHARIEKPNRVSFHTAVLRPHWFVNVDSRMFAFTDVSWEWELISIQTEINSLAGKEVQIASPHRLLAIACRQLAENAEANNRYEEASRFRYWAMDLARRTKWRGWSFWKTDWLHILYWAVSGYGERILRALGVLAAVWFVFVMLYVRVGFEQKLAKPSNEGASSVTAESMTIEDRIGKPLEFSRALTYSLAVMSLQKPEPKPLTGTAQTLVLLETILGPVQAALLALAIRRKFMR